MIVTVFRARSRPDADFGALERIGARMDELVRGMPGFISYKDFSAPDGEAVTIVEFDTLEHQQAWREQIEHATAQRAGRESFFAEYRIVVCQSLRESRFPQ
ncbi:MAG TPA: antibiotic biosynthesis monooxygenase [Polyangiaceae bacterium]|jgi:heme-degrading monooxygenase HmoA|nr:antibiotic biosynthesis monooxygenase [Polyangiaceae bacterium]